MTCQSHDKNLNKLFNETTEFIDLINETNTTTKQTQASRNHKSANEHKFTKEKLKYIEGMMKEVLYNSLAQACIKIYQTKDFKLRIFLLMSIIVLNSLASYLVVQSILSYFDYEVITISRTIYETPTLFPKVVICNQNMLQTE